jgi:alkyl sulfatase BDS1-like metallo-beta-lactamase superfamily hydrolase
VTIRSSLAAFAAFAAGSTSFDELVNRDDFLVEGNLELLRELVTLLDVFEFGFEIVLP